MDDFGFFRVAAASPEVRIADPSFNASKIIDTVRKADLDNVGCLVFPELSVTAYTCGDLFSQDLLIQEAEEAVALILEKTKDCNLFFAIGAPVMALGKRFNCALFLGRGKLWGIVPKTYLPNYNEFYEQRWFESGRNLRSLEIEYAGSPTLMGTDLIFECDGVKIGIELCEDLWVPNPPSSLMAMAGAEVILNLSASDDIIGKRDYLTELIKQQSARCRCGYVYSSAGWGESSTDLVFSAKNFIAEDGAIFAKEDLFPIHPIYISHSLDIEKIRNERAKFNTFSVSEDYLREFRVISCGFIPSKEPITAKDPEFKVDPYPFVPLDPKKLDQRCQEIIDIQAFGLMKRLDAIGAKKVVIGISGGLDSTLALLVALKAFNRLNLPLKNIIGVTMPGLATSSRTKNNATLLMEYLGVTALEIPIGEAVALHFRDIGQDPEKYDATFENSQARERTQILMDLANKEGGIVVGTGDMSELALGWATYNGDQMSMYGVNASVPKTLVKHLVKWFTTVLSPEVSKILLDICDTPISPELVPSKDGENIDQKTEDLVGPYELHDFFLFHFLRNSFPPKKIFFLAKNAFKGAYDETTILKWMKVFFKRFFSQQFKRSCMPDGPKVGSVNLSPRGDWRMPSDASVALWLKQIDNL
ncbi:MAG: NAD(+) synthase [Muribaculaceae bacterium]|nr:NAD(+) synthase [Muribaculaceae bacterium]